MSTQSELVSSQQSLDDFSLASSTIPRRASLAPISEVEDSEVEVEMNSMTLDDRRVGHSVGEFLVNQAALDAIAEEDGQCTEQDDCDPGDIHASTEVGSTAASSRSEDEMYVEQPHGTYSTYI